MDQITFNGEHLFIGNLGKLFVILSFVSALFAAYSFWHANNKKDKLSESMARVGFGIHVVAVLGIIVSLFYIIYNHYFEYYYAWQHSSLALPTHYMISCFWEGQEGSFLLWMFWQAVLGIFIMMRPDVWRNPVMAVIMLAQAVLTSMLLGFEVTDSYTFGTSPFILLREARPELLELPVMALRNIAKSDYLQIIKDGTGLNPLLQNYWMVIHPPTLFFGFATTIVPFAYAIAGLWNHRYKEWTKPALPWALISAMVLGTGIIMGGIWAYESLSFGGYWAWDPVENASLVPWLMLIAGIHVMLINKSTGQSLILGYLLIMLTYILVLYATFLTRSGVLGDSSVHSFTDLGLSRQLLVFLFMFALLPVLVSIKTKTQRMLYAFIILVVLVLNILMGKFLVGLNGLVVLASIVYMISNFNKNLPLTKHEESVYSREFWMFIGSLILVLSAVQVISSTSIPVFNKITSALGSWIFTPLYNITHLEVFKNMAIGNIATPIDAIEHYNRWQLPLAVIIAFLTGLVQFFKYKQSKPLQVAKRLGIITLIALAITVALSFLFELRIKGEFMLVILLFAACFAIVGNLVFFISVIKLKWKISGASVAHIGFGLMLIGVLVSSARKEVISINTRVDYGDKFDPIEKRQNILLMKNTPIVMGPYTVTYTGDSTEGPNMFYAVNYKHNETGETFTLYPNAQYTPDQGLMPNPDTRHYLLKDIYTHVSSVPEKNEGEDDWEEVKKNEMEVGDTLMVNRAQVILLGVRHVLGDTISQDLKGHDMHIAELQINYGDSSWMARPLFGVKDQTNSYNIFSIAERAGIRFNYYPPGEDNPDIHGIETSIKPPRYIIMKAIVFPYINLLWTGTILMIVGFGLAIARRRKLNTKIEV